MKKLKTLFATLALVASTIFPSSAQQNTWSQMLEKTNPDQNSTVATDPAGNTFVYGSFSQTLVLGTTTLTPYLTGSPDLFLAKYNNQGTLLWVEQIGGPGDDVLFALAVDTAGNAFISGRCSSSCTILSNTTTMPGGFLAKIPANPTANIWVQHTGDMNDPSTGGFEVTVMDTDEPGNLYFGGMAAFINTVSGFPLQNNTLSYFTAKVNPVNASYEWVTEFNSMGPFLMTDLKVTPSGVIALTGGFQNPDRFWIFDKPKPWNSYSCIL